jgi:hypothetical protein
LVPKNSIGRREAVLPMEYSGYMARADGVPAAHWTWFLAYQEFPPGSYKASSMAWAVDRGYFGMLIAGLVNSAASMFGAHLGAVIPAKP